MFIKKELTENLKKFQVSIKSLFLNNNLSNKDKGKLFDTEFKDLLNFLEWKHLIF